MTMQSKPDVEDQTSGTKPLPCLHDARKFVNVMPRGLSPELLRNSAQFFPTCPYFAIEGSRYCRPHTVMNNAVTTRELATDINQWQEYTIERMADGYIILFRGSMFRDQSYLFRNCRANGVPEGYR